MRKGFFVTALLILFIFTSNGHALDYKALIQQLNNTTVIGSYPSGIPKRKCHEAYHILESELKKKPVNSKLVNLLIEAVLNSKSPRIRFRSVLLLGEVKTERILSILERVLSTDKDAHVRKCAALEIGFHRQERSIPVLIKALNDPSLSVRLEAITALGKIGRSATPILIKMLRTELARKKIRIVTTTRLIYALMSTKDRRAIDVLIQSASHENPSLRAHSVRALGLFSIEAKRYSHGVICSAGAPVDSKYKIQEKDRQRAKQAIIKALSDPHKWVRKSAEEIWAIIDKLR